MNSCKIIYFLFVLLYCILYCTNNTWIVAADFKWPHFIFLLSCLLLFERYSLVPDILQCPYFYILYKIVAAVVLANALLLTIFLQIEDLLGWVIISFADLVKKTGISLDEHLKNERAKFIVELLLTLYLLVMVIRPQSQGATSSPATNQNLCPTNLPSPTRRRRRSRVRC